MTRITRRQFLRQIALGAAALSVGAPATVRAQRRVSPNARLNLGVIGVANQGNYNARNVAGENIVALCDVDDTFLAAAAQKFPQAKTYNDFRRLLDRKDIDAVVISTPDHTHAVAAVAALQSGRHVYCEKPLTRTISECRIVTDLARRQKLITQIGTQIHSGENYHQVVDLIQTGAIGGVSEVHVWVGATYGGKDAPRDKPPVPANLHYDLWLGPVAHRPYHPEYLPIKWRNWWAFGGGALADFGCHFMDLPHWALGLRAPLTAEAEGPRVHPESTPPWLIVRYEYPAAGGTSSQGAPLRLTWYHGGRQPRLLPPEVAKEWESGVLFIGNQGMLQADYTRHVVMREKDFKDYVAPQRIVSDFTQHHKEWLQAVKTGRQPSCNFDYSGPLTEAALLGNVAYRLGKKIEWDAKNLKAKGCPEADRFIQHHYRAGWKI